jgi:hypothetical protein
LRRAHERAISGLEESRLKLTDAAAKATSLVKDLHDVHNPEFQSIKIAARLQQIKLKAERAAVDDSINEIRSNLKKLK